jgi:hypothetical protein
MCRFQTVLCAIAAVACLVLFPAPSSADTIYDVTVNIAAPGEVLPAIDFYLFGATAGSNTVKITNFNFDGTPAVGVPYLGPGASGNVTTGVTLVDNGTLTPAEFTQGFVGGPPTTLMFKVDFVSPISFDPPFGDSFAFSMFTGYPADGSNPNTDGAVLIPTTDFTGANTLLNFTLAPGGTPNTVDPSGPYGSSPYAGGPADGIITVTARQETSVVPEPSCLLLLCGLAVSGTGLGVLRRRSRRA